MKCLPCSAMLYTSAPTFGQHLKRVKFTILINPIVQTFIMSGRREKRRLLPALLPILPVDNRVLLPGSSMVVEVNDPRG